MAHYHIRFSWRFRWEFDEICNFIRYELQNPIAAENFVNLYLKKILILKLYPYSFPTFDSYSKSKRYFIIKNYTFIYSINELSKTVYLERCLYSKSNLNNKK